MKASIGNIVDLIVWTKDELGWTKEETLDMLKGQSGAWKPAGLTAYNSDWVCAVGQNGHEEEELEAG